MLFCGLVASVLCPSCAEGGDVQAGGEALAVLVDLLPTYFSEGKEGASLGHDVKFNTT